MYIQFVTVPVRGVDDWAGRKAITKERLPVYGKGCVDKGGRIYAVGLSWKGEHPSNRTLKAAAAAVPIPAKPTQMPTPSCAKTFMYVTRRLAKQYVSWDCVLPEHSGSCNDYRRLASSNSAAWARVVPVIFLPPSIRAISSCRAASSSRSTRLETEFVERVFSTFR